MKALHPAQPVADIPNVAEGQVEATNVSVIDFSGGIKEVQTVVAATFAASGQGDYVVIENTGGTKHAYWLDKDANGTAPTGAAYVASGVKSKVSIVTGDTAALVAAALKAKIDSDGFFTTSINSATVTITQLLTGNATAPARHNTGDSGNGSFTVATVTGGVVPDLNNKYFLFSSSALDYYAWFNVNGAGADPLVASRTAVPVACTGEETAAQLATLAAAQITALAAVNSEADGSKVLIFNDTAANVLNAAAGNSGFTVVTQAQGLAANESKPSGNLGASSNVTSVISALT